MRRKTVGGRGQRAFFKIDQSMKITVVGQAKAKAEKEQIVKQELLNVMELTRSEPGCINYDIHQATEDKTVFMTHENWETRSALEAHLEKPYVKALLGRSEELFVGPVEITLWEKVQ